MPKYLLDTNAVQSISRKTLLAAHDAGNQLLISPISFYELATHLDEQNFKLRRGNARKGILFEVLHDPLAEIMADLGCAEAVNPSRFLDQKEIRTVLMELEAVDSYAALMNREISRDGQKQPIGDFARNARNVFDQEHKQFEAAMRKCCKDYVVRYGRLGTIELSGKEFCLEATGLARKLVEDARQVGCATTFNQMAARLCLTIKILG